jgi:hypothetical protein
VRAGAPCCLLVLVSAAVCRAAPPAPAELVRRLGDPAFAVREQAAGELRTLGADAVAALRAGLKSSDAEVRDRCRELLAEVLRADREARLAALRSGEEDARRPPPAGWRRFARLAGDGKAARAAYAELYAAEPDLLETAEGDPDAAAGPVAEQAGALAGLCITPGKDGQAVALATRLVFLAADGRVPLGHADRAALAAGLEVLAGREALRTAFLREPFRRRLLLAFLERSPPESLERVLTVAGAFAMRESAGWALGLARDRGRPAALRARALLVLGRAGGREHVAGVEALFDDAGRVGDRKLGRVTLHCQVRDVALATAVRLAGGKPEDYGFPYPRALPGVEDVPHPACLGFTDDAARRAAFRKWKERPGGR